ncbi:MAG: TonB-dependent receptor [Desulfobacteraceae bacterium]
MKTLHFLVFLVLGLFILVGSSEAADEAAKKTEEQEPVMMKEVVVTATRYEEETVTVPASVSVITEEDIANSTAQDIPSILMREAGIYVVDIGGNRRQYRVDRAGFGETASSNTLALVDGRRINNPDLSASDWWMIPLERVERIEIIRGSRGSILYGDNATSAVINIITKEGEEFKAGLLGAGGSWDTIKTNAYVSGTHKNFFYAVSGKLYDTDGYRDNSQIKSDDVGLNLGYLFGESAKVSLSGGYHKDDAGLPGALRLSDLQAGIPRTGTVYPDDFANTEDNYIQLNPELFFLQNSLFKTPLSYRKRETLQFATFVGGEFEGNTEIKSVTASPQFVIKEPISKFDNNLTFGFDYYKADEDIFNESLFFGFLTIGEFELEKKNYGFYIHDEFYPIKALSLSAGLRYDKVEYKFYPTAPGTPDKTKYDETPLTAGINYNFYKDSYAYFSFSEGFRYPLLDELFSFFTNTISTDLVPQTSDNFELGLRHYFTKSLYADVNLFRLDTKNEIFFNSTTFANENLDAETRRDGLEVLLGFDYRNVSLRGTYTYRDTEIRGGANSGNEVPAVPKHQATFDAIWYPIDRVTFALNGVYVGSRYLESDFENKFPKQDDYVVVNAKLKYNWNKITAFLDVNNLFDEEYAAYGVVATFPEEPAFFPSPEINFLFGIRYDY